MRFTDYEQICEWVISAWDSVSTDIICRSFKSCGISVSLDGSEDFLISCFKKGNPCEDGATFLSQSLLEVTSQELMECPQEDEENYIDESDSLICNMENVQL